jgi:hypothetical protein
MILLSLDLATNIGWTIGEHDDPAFLYGTHKLPRTGDDIGHFLLAYDDWLSKMRVQYMPSNSLPKNEIVFEAPILPRQTRIETVRKLNGLASHTEYFCICHNIRCMEAQVWAVRSFLKIHGRDQKAQVIEAIRWYGYNAGNDDEADAIAIRLYTIAKHWPEAMRKMKFDLGPLGATNVTSTKPR